MGGQVEREGGGVQVEGGGGRGKGERAEVWLQTP